jgi:hypothetical protein
VTPPRTTRRKRLALALLAVFVLGIAATIWSAIHSVPDPIYNGHRLSWWVRHRGPATGPTGIINISSAGTMDDTPELTANDLRAMGPPAMQWLSHAIVHGRVPPGNRPPPSRVEGWLWAAGNKWQRWFNIPEDTYDEKFAVFNLIRDIGPAAAPTIPALVRALDEDPDTGHGEFAAYALARIGPASRPAILEVLGRKDSVARGNLIDGLMGYVNSDSSVELDGASAQAISYLVLLCQDPDSDIQIRAIYGLAACYRRFGPHEGVEPAAAAGLKILAEPGRKLPLSLLDALADFRQHAAPAIPHYLPLLEDPDSEMMLFAAACLARMDPSQKQAVPRLQTLLASPNPEHQFRARELLRLLQGPP